MPAWTATLLGLWENIEMPLLPGTTGAVRPARFSNWRAGKLHSTSQGISLRYLTSQCSGISGRATTNMATGIATTA